MSPALPETGALPPQIYVARPHKVALALARLYYGEPKPQGYTPVGLPAGSAATQVLADSPVSDGVLGVSEENGRLSTFAWRDRGRVRQVVGGPYLRALDLARDMAALANQYAAVEFDRDADKEKLKEVKQFLTTIEDELAGQKEEFERSQKETAGAKLPARVRAALRLHRVGAALRARDGCENRPREGVRSGRRGRCLPGAGRPGTGGGPERGGGGRLEGSARGDPGHATSAQRSSQFPTV